MFLLASHRNGSTGEILCLDFSHLHIIQLRGIQTHFNRLLVWFIIRVLTSGCFRRNNWRICSRPNERGRTQLFIVDWGDIFAGKKLFKAPRNALRELMLKVIVRFTLLLFGKRMMQKG